MKILGIDPGYAIVGFGIIEKIDNEIKALDFGVITTSPKENHQQRILQVCQDLKKIIKLHQPDCLALEKLFFAKNAKTALPVAEARGAILLQSALQKIPLFEYSPNQVKISVSGNGRADKTQIQKMVSIILGLSEIPQPDDAADALAIAICHSQHQIYKSHD